MHTFICMHIYVCVSILFDVDLQFNQFIQEYVLERLCLVLDSGYCRIASILDTIFGAFLLLLLFHTFLSAVLRIEYLLKFVTQNLS